LKKLLAASLITGISAASCLLSIVNPAFATPAQTVSAGKAALFDRGTYSANARLLCARTLDGKTGQVSILEGAYPNILQVTSKETCVRRSLKANNPRIHAFIDKNSNSKSLSVFLKD
jgi:hypothetical protein